MTTSFPCILLLSFFLHAFVTNCIHLFRNIWSKLFWFMCFCSICLPKKPFFVGFGLKAASHECQKIVGIYSEILRAYGCRLICSKQLIVLFIPTAKTKTKICENCLIAIVSILLLHWICPVSTYIKVKYNLFSLMHMFKFFMLWGDSRNYKPVYFISSVASIPLTDFSVKGCATCI